MGYSQADTVTTSLAHAMWLYQDFRINDWLCTLLRARFQDIPAKANWRELITHCAEWQFHGRALGAQSDSSKALKSTGPGSTSGFGYFETA